MREGVESKMEGVRPDDGSGRKKAVQPREVMAALKRDDAGGAGRGAGRVKRLWQVQLHRAPPGGPRPPRPPSLSMHPDCDAQSQWMHPGPDA